MANVTITTAANFIPELWAVPVLKALEKNVVLQPLTNRAFEGFDRSGDTIHVPGVASFSARTLTNMTGTLTFDSNTESVTDISVNTLAYHAVKVDSAAGVQSKYPMMSYYTEKQGIALAIKVDTDIGSALDTGVTQNEGVDAVDLTDDDILGAIEQVNVANADPNDRFMPISTKTYESFMKIDKFVNSLYASVGSRLDGSKGRGYMGRIYDADVYVSTNLPAGTAGTVNFYFQRECLAHVMQREIASERRIPHDELAEAIIVWAIYGNKIMRATVGVELRGK